MSFDDGTVFDLDIVGVKSRLKAAMIEKRVGMKALHSLTGLTELDLEKAFQSIEHGDPEAVRVISLAAQAIGVAPEWVLTGRGKTPLTARGKLIKIAWEFIYTYNFTHEIGKQFEMWLLGRFSWLGKAPATNELFRREPSLSVEGMKPLFEEFDRDKRNP